MDNRGYTPILIGVSYPRIYNGYGAHLVRGHHFFSELLRFYGLKGSIKPRRASEVSENFQPSSEIFPPTKKQPPPKRLGRPTRHSSIENPETVIPVSGALARKKSTSRSCLSREEPLIKRQSTTSALCRCVANVCLEFHSI